MVRTRFAPSPTGFMHVGNLRTCLYAYLYARANGGEFILRIEDTDRERLVDGAVDTIYRTLEKAGIIHDEGPDKGGDYGPYVQSERKNVYIECAKELIKTGAAYYCFCGKERLGALGGETGIKKYDKKCMDIPLKEAEKRALREPYVIRQNVPTEGISSYNDLVYGEITVPNSDMEDGILIKSDGMPTYNFANVVDDHLMRITHVMRGAEYLSSTPKYNLLYDAFGWARPEYMHLPAIMKDESRKLSKRYGDANFEDYLAKGFVAEAIVNYIALLGWSPANGKEKMTMDEMIECFSPNNISRSGSILDEKKMRWLNQEYVKLMSIEEFLTHARPYLDKSGAAYKYDYVKLARLLLTRTEIFSDIPLKLEFLNNFGKYDTELFVHKKMKTDKKLSKEILINLLPVLSALSEWNEEILVDAMTRSAELSGVKKGQVFLVTRLALTGAESTPGGASEMADLLGRDVSLERISYSINLLKETEGEI